MPDAHPLDRPIWNALTSGWAALAEGDGHARRLMRDYGLFGAAADDSPDAALALAALIPADGELWTVERAELPPPSESRRLRSADCVQMVAATITPATRDFDIVDLTEEDAPEMLALATLTKPGPYVARTNRLGRFVGIKREGRLIAMAGERMRMPGHVEVSGVCTHPDGRGRGYAGALMRRVAERMIAEGHVPFLHAYADNAGAIALYESLGFRTRCTVVASVLVPA